MMSFYFRGGDFPPMKKIACCFAALLIALTVVSSPVLGQRKKAAATPASSARLYNPLLPGGPDPWVIYRDGYYYYMNTMSINLTIWKTRSLANLRSAEKKAVWLPPPSGPSSHELWAPELHFLQGKWYIYFAADEGTNDTHRVFVLENSAADPLTGTWVMKGKLADPSADHWAIDPTVFEDHGNMYALWSGWDGDVNGTQSIFIARLSNPWTIEGHRAKLSTPQYPWEKVGDLTKPNEVSSLPHVDVNEGPEILQHGDKIFLIYSASGCWTDYYELGMLTASSGSDLLDPASWTKSNKPVFWQNPDVSVYAPGHNSFFQSPDGKEDWILYHANEAPGEGCENHRSPRAQRFTWRADGTPDFGRPVSVFTPQPRPSGEVGP
jgi:GH43 family beta-xylosidase